MVKLALADDLVARVNRLAVLVDLAQELLVTRIIGSSTYITGNRKEGQGKTGKPIEGAQWTLEIHHRAEMPFIGHHARSETKNSTRILK